MVMRAHLKGRGDFTTMKQERTLEVLRDFPIETASEEDPFIKYPAHDKDKATSMFRGALIVAQLRRAIEKAYSTKTKKELKSAVLNSTNVLDLLNQTFRDSNITAIPANHQLFNLRNGSRFEERWSTEKAR
jgi:hypothetical protein